jgi:hypothetical protein
MHRRYVYESGPLNQPEKGKIKVIEDKVLNKEDRGTSVTFLHFERVK